MKTILVFAALVAATAALIARRNAIAWGLVSDGEPDQLPTLLETVQADLNPLNYRGVNMSNDQADRNLKAFLDMIAYSEGTSGPDGYRTLFGGGKFDSFADHPRVYKSFTNGIGQVLKTSAAGRYQFLAKTWDAMAAALHLPDFGPESQDRAAIELISQRGALNDVRAGRTENAIRKCAPIWASMPGAGYAQPERKLSALVAQYRAAGGVLEAA